MGYLNNWTACQNFQTGHANDWMAYENYRIGYPNDWMACENYWRGWHRQMKGFMINFRPFIKKIAIRAEWIGYYSEQMDRSGLIHV